MAYTYFGTQDIIKLPGRSVATFPSGLVRVDRTYACRIEKVGLLRKLFAVGNLLPNDDGTPAIDGLYIFPEVQETRRVDGFVEFKVSGYGRTNTIGQTSSKIQDAEATLIETSLFPPITTTSISKIPIIIEVITTQRVAFSTIPTTEIFPEFIDVNVFIKQNKKIVKIEEVFKPGTTSNAGIFTLISIQNLPTIQESQGTNFGTMKEIIFNFSAEITIRKVISDSQL